MLSLAIHGAKSRIGHPNSWISFSDKGGHELSTNRSRKSRLMFDLPVYTDWLFYLFLFFLFANWTGSFSRVQQSGGIDTSTFSLISGSFDVFFGLVISWVMAGPFYFARRIYRRVRKNSEK